MLLTTPQAAWLLPLPLLFGLVTARGRRNLASFDPFFALIVIAVLALPYAAWVIRSGVSVLPPPLAFTDLIGKAEQWGALLAWLVAATAGLFVLIAMNSRRLVPPGEDAPVIFRPPVDATARAYVYFFAFVPALLGSLFAALYGRAKTGKQYEVGIKYQPVGVNALITLAAFDLTRANVVTFPPPTFAAVQTGEINSRGIELEGTTTLAEGFNIRGAYSYIHAVVTKDPVNVGNAPSTVPLNRFAVWSDYTFQGGPLAGIQVGGGLRYVGSTFVIHADAHRVQSSDDNDDRTSDEENSNLSIF